MGPKLRVWELNGWEFSLSQTLHPSHTFLIPIFCPPLDSPQRVPSKVPRSIFHFKTALLPAVRPPLFWLMVNLYKNKKKPRVTSHVFFSFLFVPSKTFSLFTPYVSCEWCTWNHCNLGVIMIIMMMRVCAKWRRIHTYFVSHLASRHTQPFFIFPHHCSFYINLPRLNKNLFLYNLVQISPWCHYDTNVAYWESTFLSLRCLCLLCSPLGHPITFACFYSYASLPYWAIQVGPCFSNLNVSQTSRSHSLDRHLLKTAQWNDTFLYLT